MANEVDIPKRWLLGFVVSLNYKILKPCAKIV